MRLLGIVFLLALTNVTLFAQNKADEIPRAFLIGEYESYYEQLVVEHRDQLLNVCNNSMEKAYTNWTDVMVDLEQFADSRDFDIKGTKVWINIFWNADGTVRHIVYYPKPNSKNMDFQLLSDLLSDFAASYQFVISFDRPFSHYGSSSFPTFYTPAVDK